MSKQNCRKHKKITAKNATPEQYAASSIIRFGRLKTYIQEKILIDYFAIEGNLTMVESFKEYIERNLKELRKRKKIKILDAGPAIGAISTLLCLQALEEFELLEKAQVHFIDLSTNVIDCTQQCDFTFPDSIVNPELKSKILKKLRDSKAHIGSAEDMPWKAESFHVVIACFLFHHLHDKTKPLVAQEMIRVLKPNGFLGIAEEWFKSYEKYKALHKNDRISLAYESLISLNKLSKFFLNNLVLSSQQKPKNNCYTFCATKPPKH